MNRKVLALYTITLLLLGSHLPQPQRWHVPPLFNGMLSATFNPSAVKNRVTGSISMTAGNTSVTGTTHTGVAFANALLFFDGFSSAGENSSGAVRINLNQSGSDVNVTAVRIASAATTTVRYSIVEYIPLILKSVQRNTVATSSSSAGTRAVTQTGAKWTLNQLGVTTSDNASGNNSNWTMDIQYDGMTTVTGTPGANGASATITSSFELADWR